MDMHQILDQTQQVIDARKRLLKEMEAMHLAVEAFEDDLMAEKGASRDKVRRMHHAALVLRHLRIGFVQALMASRQQQ